MSTQFIAPYSIPENYVAELIIRYSEHYTSKEALEIAHYIFEGKLNLKQLKELNSKQ